MSEPDDDQGDDQIAAIARVNGFMIATRNTADFEDCGVDLVNPFAMRAPYLPPVESPCAKIRRCRPVCRLDLPILRVRGCYTASLERQFHRREPEWRNWQTHQTQNLAGGDTRGGSTPPSGTTFWGGVDFSFFSCYIISNAFASQCDECAFDRMEHPQDSESPRLNFPRRYRQSAVAARGERRVSSNPSGRRDFGSAIL